MDKQYLNGYIAGMMKAYTSVGKNMRFSMIETLVGNVEEIKYILSVQAGKAIEDFEAVETEETLVEILAPRLDGKTDENLIAEKLLNDLQMICGKEQGILRFEDEKILKDSASGYEDQWGPFYITEDIFIAEFESVAILFIIGNDE